MNKIIQIIGEEIKKTKGMEKNILNTKVEKVGKI